MSFFKKAAFWKAVFKGPHYSNDKIPDLTSKVALITGANTGLGYATMVALAGHGAHVIAACRSEQRATEAIEKAKQEIKNKYPNASEPQIDFLQLDLNDINNSAQAAKNFLSMGIPLHILVNNGGIATTPFALSADGIEQQLAINHVGHFVFTMGLLQRIKESQPSRIVVVSSMLHEVHPKGGIDFKTLNDGTLLSPGVRYGRSKLANLLFAKDLARRLKDERVYVNVAHPGLVATELNRSNEATFGKFGSRFLEALSRIFAVKPEVGALTQLYCATSPEIEERNCRGKYFIPIAHELDPTPIAFDEELQERLWSWTESAVHERLKA
ncbi:hypothetical protein MVEG_11172 [Podila verticillata NRRL 6337]|uniref:NAD(P)-binding protein n=1 Tax=Podila verticillata NRRL 6337 TaxID=1069443 RepID=A0A086TMF8_9FUNG|nr:hypothetical protein MVEG_11172 [Podila verticillata NRRL 6337]